MPHFSDGRAIVICDLVTVTCDPDHATVICDLASAISGRGRDHDPDRGHDLDLCRGFSLSWKNPSNPSHPLHAPLLVRILADQGEPSLPHNRGAEVLPASLAAWYPFGELRS